MTDGAKAFRSDEIQIRLLYLTCTEFILDYGIFDTQVKDLLRAIAKHHGRTIETHLLSLVPAIRFVKWKAELVFVSGRGLLRRLRAELASMGITGTFFPLLSAYPFHTWGVLGMVAALPLAAGLVVIYVWRNRITLLHCRGYHAGLVGLIVNRLLGVPYIFEPRSLWIEERVIEGEWRRGSWSYRLWKRLEIAISRNSAACVVVSEPLEREFAAKAPRVEIIYTTAAEIHFEPFEVNKPKVPSELPALKGARGSARRFALSVGSFNARTPVDHVLAQYGKLREVASPCVLIIITATPERTVRDALKRMRLSWTDVVVVKLSSDSVPQALRHAEYGLLLMPESPVSRSVTSVKLAEYLAAGLPVICDSHIEGAANIIRRHAVGLVLSQDWRRNEDALKDLHEHYEETSERCRKAARELFHVDVHAGKYVQLYREAAADGAR